MQEQRGETGCKTQRPPCRLNRRDGVVESTAVVRRTWQQCASIGAVVSQSELRTVRPLNFSKSLPGLSCHPAVIYTSLPGVILHPAAGSDLHITAGSETTPGSVLTDIDLTRRRCSWCHRLFSSIPETLSVS